MLRKSILETLPANKKDICLSETEVSVYEKGQLDSKGGEGQNKTNLDFAAV